MAEEKIIIDIEIDSEKAGQDLLQVEKQLQKVRQARSELNKEIATAKKEGKQLTDEQIKQSIQLEKEQKALSDQKRRLVKETETEKNSVNALRLEISKLTAIRANLNTQTEEGQKQFAELTEQLKEYNEQLNDSSKAAGNFKDNIGNYTESIKEAFSASSILEGGLSGLSATFSGALTQGVAIANQAFLLLAANPVVAAIVAIVAAITALISVFASTEKGAEKLQQVFAGLQPVIDLVTSALSAAGEVLFFLIEGLGNVANSIADFFGLAATESKNLVKDLQAVEKEIIKNEAAQKGLRAEEERLRKVRDDESKSFKERIAANEQLGKVEKKRIDDTLALEEKKLKALERQFELIPKNLRTTEDIQKVEEQRAKVNELIEESQGIQAEQIQNQNALIKEQNELRNETRKVLLDLEVAQGKLNDTSDEYLKRQKQIVEERRKAQLSETEDATARVKINAEADLEILTLTKDFNDRRIAAYEDYVSAVQEQNEAAKQAQIKALQDQIAGYELELLKLQQGTAEYLRLRNEALKIANKIELLEFEGTENQRTLLIQNQKRLQAAAEINEIKTLETQKLQIAADFSKVILSIDQMTEKDATNIKKAAVNARMKLDRIEEESAIQKVGQIGQAFGAVGQILGEQTEAGKVFASVQAGINAALAISQTLADSTLPFFLKIPSAILIGIEALKQIKKINSTEVPGYAGGGVISGGSPIQRGNGDNVLITARKGEVILNEDQQQKLGGASTFAAIGVPGFDDGGVVQSQANQVFEQVQNQNELLQASNNQPEIIVRVRDIELGENRRAARLSQSEF